MKGFHQFEWQAATPPGRERDAKRAKHFAQQLPKDWSWNLVAYPSWEPPKCAVCCEPPVMYARRTDRLQGGQPEPPEYEIHCGQCCETIGSPSDTPEDAIADYGRAVQAFLNGGRRFGDGEDY